MGFDMHMIQQPTAAEAKQAGLDQGDPGYFRYNMRAMPIMVMTMTWAGVVVDDEAEPVFPPIPESLPEARKDAMSKALSDLTLDAKLPAADREIVVKYRAVLHSHSKHPGKVPAYKFQVNDGFIVAPDECLAIAKALRSYQPDAAKLGKLKRIWHDASAPLTADAEKRGEKVIIGNEELQLSVGEWKTWIAEFAAYNELAARHGGYTVD